jgi:acyl transferase domain-containing protein/NADPH:quinone reductase-like Zn-dependent oxidoreductase/acyl carrier protein
MEQQDGATRLRRALRALDTMQNRLESLEQAQREPIAIVGLACRFPGADDPDEFWDLLRDGQEPISEIPESRWRLAEYYNPDPELSGKMVTRRAGLLQDTDQFDPAFFGISPREARTMDPQQRLLLETAWHALEHAGIDPQVLAGTETGVFVGLSACEYDLLVGAQAFSAIDIHDATGTSASVGAGRISFVLGLQGPSLTVDTACSSSLVALHLAMQSLRRGECTLALAAGVNRILLPDLSIVFSKARMLSPGGRCRTFDAAADGFVRAEGGGVAVLKRLRDAQAAGDTILAVLRGSAVNQDGRTSGLTVPNGPAQQAVIRRALQDAGLAPEAIDYVEAHGTGTALGDPIEMAALGQVFGAAARPEGRPLMVGSVKTNLGHLEAAAGMAGLMKTVLALRHAAIPPHLHLTTPNPAIDWAALPVTIPTTLTPWPATPGRPRRAGLSAFGFSGTNAHLVLEEAPVLPLPADCLAGEGRDAHVITVSGRSGAGARALALRYAEHLRQHPELDLADVAHTANTGRARLRHRLSVVARDVGSASAGLEAAGQNPAAAEVAAGSPRIGFLFPGQGVQYAGMGAALYRTQPQFRAALDQADAVLRDELEQPLLEVLYGAHGRLLEQTAYAQPALVALGQALAGLWRSWGIVAEWVLGHSVGELAAASCAGLIDPQAALVLAARRGQLMQALPAGGAMLAVAAPWAAVSGQLPRQSGVVLAAENGVETVLSGAQPALAGVEAHLTAAGFAVRRLASQHAFHSPLMAPMAAVLDGEAAALLSPPGTAAASQMISTLTGGLLVDGLAAGEGYWGRQAQAPVQFAGALSALSAAGCTLAVELGPRPVLTALGRRGAAGQGADQGARLHYLASLDPARGDWAGLLESVGRLYEAGAPVDWAAVEAGPGRRRVALPGYPFQRTRHWVEAAPRRQLAAPRAAGEAAHALLGRRLAVAPPAVVYEAQLCAQAPAYLADHTVAGTVIAPAAALLEIALAAGREVFGQATIQLQDVVFEKPLILNDTKTTIQCVLTPEADGGMGFVVSSLAEADTGVWHRHASGHVRVLADAAEPERAATLLPPGLTEQTDPYAGWAAARFEYGGSFRTIRRLWSQGEAAVAEVALDAALPFAGHGVHPALLDGCLQAVLGLIAPAAPVLPYAVASLSLRAPLAAQAWSRATLREARADGSVLADVDVYRPDGILALRIDGLTLRPQETPTPKATIPALYAVEWANIQNTKAKAEDGLLVGIERVAAGYAAQALRRFGWPQKAAVELAQAVSPRRQALLKRLLALAPSGASDPSALMQTLQDWHPEAEIELELLQRCGESLAEVLSDEQDSVSLLFPDGNMASLTRLYAESRSVGSLNTLAREAVLAAIRARPDGVIRILEIGAGTGGMTSAVLPHLPAERVTYTFTDISRLFTTRAASRFAAYPFVTYQALDIARSLEGQGIETGVFDLVIAANVLHATPDLAATLERVHALLTGDSTLILLEATGRRAWIDTIFGVTDGWWSFTDQHLRPDHPLLTSSSWEKLLSQSGFTAAASLPGRAAQAVALSPQAVIVATCGAGPSPAALLANAQSAIGGASWLVLSDELGSADEVVQGLERAGGQVAAGSLSGDVVAGRPASATLDVVCLCTSQVGMGQAGAGQPGVGQAGMEQAGDAAAAAEAVSLAVLSVVQALIRREGPSRLWLVTRGAVAVDALETLPGLAGSALWGLGKVVALEHGELGCRRIDLDPSVPWETAAAELLAELGAADDEEEVAWRRGARFGARLMRRPAAPVYPAQLSQARRGTLDELAFAPLQRRAPGPGEIELRVEAAGLNFRDVMVALDNISRSLDDELLGGECVGRVVSVGSGVDGFLLGSRVAALTGGAFADYVTVPAELAAHVPEGLAAPAAAALPLAWATARAALLEAARLEAGERVLVHAASGGVGQALVRLAQQRGAVVLGTSSPEKWPVLQKLGIAAPLNSRVAQFAEAVRSQTGGRGVDVVVNCLSGAFIAESLAALAPGGRFIELGKNGIWTAAQVAAARPDVRYHVVDLLARRREAPGALGAELRQVMAQAASLKTAAPTVLPLREAAVALRRMQQARHVGKLVLAMPSPVWEAAADGAYVVTGGLGGLGQQVAAWLVVRGARRVVLTSRRAPDAGLRLPPGVVARQADAADAAAMASVVAELEAEGWRLAGLFHAAGVLADGALRQQDPARFTQVLAPKLRGAWNLHMLTQGRAVDVFVLFSSTASLLGSAGQGNHAAANAFLDSLAAWRRGQGLAGVSINWGPWSEVGAAAGGVVEERMRQQGLLGLAPSAGLAGLETVLTEAAAGSSTAQIGIAAVDWARLVQRRGAGRYLSLLAPKAAPAVGTPDAGLRGLPWATAQAQVRRLVAEEVASVLGLAGGAAVQPDQGFFDQGLDSLTSVELRNRLQRALGLKLSATTAFDYPTLETLSNHLLKTIQPDGPPQAGAPLVGAPSEGAMGAAPVELDEEDIADALARELGGFATLESQRG